LAWLEDGYRPMSKSLVKIRVFLDAEANRAGNGIKPTELVCSVAVELGFKNPVRAAKRLLHRGSLHWRDELW
jgi:hypothetical protein